MTTGTIKFFDTEKEFGFIVPTDGSVDIFVHKTGLNEVVRADDAVSFTVKQGQKALEAVNVSKI